MRGKVTVFACVGALVALGAATPCSAKPLGLDGSFSVDGSVTFQLPGDDASVAALLVDRSGRTLVAYQSVIDHSPGGDQGDLTLIRLLPDGSFDQGFGAAGSVQLGPSTGHSVVAVRELGDGSIAVSWFARGASSGSAEILDGNGAPVGSSELATAFPVEAVALTPQGLTIAGGALGPPEPGQPEPGFSLERFDAGGSPDPGWGSGGIVQEGSSTKSVNSIAVDALGEVGVATGYSYGPGGDTPGELVYAFDPSGQLFGSAFAGSDLGFRDGGLTVAGGDFVSAADIIRSSDAGYRVSAFGLTPSGDAVPARDYDLEPPVGHGGEPWAPLATFGEPGGGIWATNGSGIAHLLPGGTLERVPGGTQYIVPSEARPARWSQIATTPDNRILVAGVEASVPDASWFVITRLVHGKAEPEGAGLRLIRLHQPRRFKGVRRRGISATIKCAVACRASMRVRISRGLSHRLGLSGRVIADASGTGQADARSVLEARLGKHAVAAIERVRPRKVSYEVLISAEPVSRETRRASGAVTRRAAGAFSG